jgi:FkbM family methyltransferase
MGYLLHVVRQEDVFFDVGANVGSYTILACGATGAKGYSFEPVPTTYHRLCENVMINNLQGRVNCYNVGLGEKKETLRFTANQDSTNHAVIDNLSVTQTSDGIIAGNDQPITSQITQTLIPV